MRTLNYLSNNTRIKYLFYGLAFVFVCILKYHAASAQFSPDELVTTKPAKKATNQNPIPVKKEAKTNTKVKTTITVDANAFLYIDMENKGLVLKNSIMNVELLPGNHPIKVISAENSEAMQAEIIAIKAGDGQQKVEMHLAEKSVKKDKAESKKVIQPVSYEGIEMLYVQGGTFTMGHNHRANDEKPEHMIEISSFYMGKFEITQNQWYKITGINPSAHKRCDNCSVENVSWDEIQEFITLLNEKSGKKYRLPTEAEWEYAAKGGEKANGYLYSGSNDLATVAWYAGDYYANSPSANPEGPNAGVKRCRRGGSWFIYKDECSVTHRNCNTPNNKSEYVGFRLAMSVD